MPGSVSMRLARRSFLTLAILSCTPPGERDAADQAETPVEILERAIEQGGGAVALGRARALRWEADATVHAGGRRVAIRGTWAIQPPDSAVVATYDTTRGPGTMRRLILAGAQGWMEEGGNFTPMPAPMLAAERDEFYLYQVMRLVPMRSSEATLDTTAADSLGQRGVEIRMPNRPAVRAFVDSAGRLAHLRLRITDATTGGQVWQDLWLSGVIESGGVRWPREIRITMDGAPYFDLVLRRLEVDTLLVEPWLAGPR
jgi:hypothetical protein